MTQTRLINTKALNAYLTGRGLSLTVALSQIGADLAHLNDEAIDEFLVGKIARRYGLTFEQMRDGAEAAVLL